LAYLTAAWFQRGADAIDLKSDMPAADTSSERRRRD